MVIGTSYFSLIACVAGVIVLRRVLSWHYSCKGFSRAATYSPSEGSAVRKKYNIRYLPANLASHASYIYQCALVADPSI